MFDAVRNNKRIVQGFLALMILPFALWGVDSYVRDSGAGNDLAAVGDTKIVVPQFEEAWREQLDRARQQLGPAFKREMFETPEARLAMLNSLIDQRLLLLEAAKGHLGVPDAALAEIIAGMPALQENGKFSRARYEAAVRGQGMSPEQFEARLRQEMTVQQLAAAVADTAIVPAAASDAMLRLLTEERQIAELRMPAAQFAGEVKLDGDAAKKFYDENQKRFQTPEQLRAEYVVLSLDELLAQVAVSDAEIKDWYDKHPERYRIAEERRASHILIPLAAGAAEADKSAARAKAEEILQEVQKAPAKFAELARKHSQDSGSAANGGDLGFFGRGMMVKPFEEAVFAQKAGDVSGIVESDFGLHIIKLTAIKEGRQKRTDEVRAEIEGELKRQGAQKRYAEAAETFTNMVYEQPDSLAPVAEKFKLAVRKTEFFPRDLPAAALASLGPLGNEKLVAALFAEDAVKNRRNTEAVEVAPNTLLAARVLEHQPATLRPFDGVRADIEKLLKNREGAVLARQRGEARLGELRGGQDKLAWSPVRTVTRLQAGQLPPAAQKAVFGADAAGLPAYVGAELPDNGGFTLFKIVAVKPAEKLDGERRRALQGNYASLIAQQEFAGYLAALRQRYKVSINKAALETAER